MDTFLEPSSQHYAIASQAIERWRLSGRTFVEQALNVGTALNALKSNTAYGSYGALEEQLAKEHHISSRTLRNYARAAELVALGSVSRQEAIAAGLKAVLSSAPKNKELTDGSLETVAEVATGQTRDNGREDTAEVPTDTALSTGQSLEAAGVVGSVIDSSSPSAPTPQTSTAMDQDGPLCPRQEVQATEDTSSERSPAGVVIAQLEAEVHRLREENEHLQASKETGRFIPTDVIVELLAIAKALLPEKKDLKTADGCEADANSDKNDAFKYHYLANIVRLRDRLVALLG